MGELHVRNLPLELHAQLRKRAEAEGRSMSAETIAILRRALQPGDDQSSKQQAAIDRLLEIQQRSRLPVGVPPAEQLVREDRNATR